jgi:hypothetical protein
MQRRADTVIGQVGIDTGLEQYAHDVDMSVPDRRVNRRAGRAERTPRRAPRIAAAREEPCDDCRVAFTCGDIQGRGAAAVGRFDPGSTGKEPLDGRKISSPRSVVKLGGDGFQCD